MASTEAPQTVEVPHSVASTSSNEETPRPTYGNNATAEFLSELKGSAVIVKQSSGVEYRGILQSVDGFLNTVLKATKEVYEEKVVSELGEVFLRGSVVDYIAIA